MTRTSSPRDIREAETATVSPAVDGHRQEDLRDRIETIGESVDTWARAESVDGTPEGLALPHVSDDRIAGDVLGGPWDDPQSAWDSMEAAISAWEPGNNTMPTLQRHPMRIVGWATFTLESVSLQRAHEYAGHAGPTRRDLLEGSRFLSRHE